MDEIVCHCSVCSKPIAQDEPMADHKVHKLGELAYIELAHRECGLQDNAVSHSTYWECD